MWWPNHAGVLGRPLVGKSFCDQGERNECGWCVWCLSAGGQFNPLAGQGVQKSGSKTQSPLPLSSLQLVSDLFEVYLHQLSQCACLFNNISLGHCFGCYQLCTIWLKDIFSLSYSPMCQSHELPMEMLNCCFNNAVLTHSHMAS